MNTLYMKVHDYDESSHSLIVSFASDETKSQDPSDYPSYAYQPMKMWPDIADPEEVRKRIAQAGITLAEQQAIEERFVADAAKVEQYRSMIGINASYSTEELTSTPVDPILDGIIPPESNVVVV